MSISKLQDIFNKERDSKYVSITTAGATQATTTAASATSGGIAMTMVGGANAIGTTTTTPTATNIQDAFYQPGLGSNPLRLYQASVESARAGIHAVSRLYKFGTADLTATGQRFTHDAATFPINRVQMGTSQPINLIPFICVTTAEITTAAVFTIKYVNAAGVTVTGAKTFTMPAAIDAVGSCYILHMEDILGAGGAIDCSVQDIIEINVSVAGVNVQVDVWGLEMLGITGSNVAALPGNMNAMTNPIVLPDINPGMATAGTAVSKLLTVLFGSASSNNDSCNMKAFIDD